MDPTLRSVFTAICEVSEYDLFSFCLIDDKHVYVHVHTVCVDCLKLKIKTMFECGSVCLSPTCYVSIPSSSSPNCSV